MQEKRKTNVFQNQNIIFLNGIMGQLMKTRKQREEREITHLM